MKIIEWMFKFQIRKHIIRVWYDTSKFHVDDQHNFELFESTKNDLLLEIQKVAGHPDNDYLTDVVANYISSLPNIAAVEVLDSSLLDGMVIYNNWP